MAFFRRFVCLALCLLWPCLALASDLDDTMTELFQRYKARGGMVVVAKGNDIVYEFCYGNAREQPQTPVTRDTRFRVASVTKLVTSIGVMQQVERGTLDLDADISNYYGATIRNPRYPDAPITPRMILSHTSSLSPSGDYKRSGNLISEMLRLSGNHAKNFYSFKPGTRYLYSNFNGGMMGSLVEVGSGENVNAYMRSNVFEPLGIEGAYAVSMLADPSLAADTYNADGSLHDNAAALASRAYDTTCSPDLHYDMTAGSLWISAPDLCRIGMALCNGGTLDDTTLLKSATVLEMISDQRGKGGITAHSIYGLGVNRVDNLLGDRLVYGHQGMSGAVLANLYWEPQQRLTFVLVSNGCNNQLDARIARLSRKAFEACWNAFYTDAFVVIDD